jgi:hypothetical protein
VQYREYLNEEQRSQPGCSAGRMQLEFHHGLLASSSRGVTTGMLSQQGRQNSRGDERKDCTA